MKKIVIICTSRTGITRQYARNIADGLKSQGHEVRLFSDFDADMAEVSKADAVLLGCWTHGLFLMGQHPAKPWKEMAGRLPSLENKNCALFTTYKLVTGSMFRKMRREIAHTGATVTLELQSRNGQITGEQRQALLQWLK